MSIIERIDPNAIKRLYWDEGLSLQQIGKRLNEKSGNVHYCMIKHNIPRRNQTDAQRHKVNDDFFRTPTHDMFYCLGMMFADGCVHIPLKSTHTPRLALNLIDRDVVRNIARVFQFEGPIREVPPRLPTAQTQWSIAITSKRLVQDIMKWGVMPRKSYRDDPFPDIPDEYLPSFVRGYFDGDGGLSTVERHRKNGKIYRELRASIVGTKRFMEGLHNALHMGQLYPKKTNSTWYWVIWRNDDLVSFHNLIYSTPGIRLHRKRKIFQDWLASREVMRERWHISPEESARRKHRRIKTNDTVWVHGRIGHVTHVFDDLTNGASVRFSTGFESTYPWHLIYKATGQKSNRGWHGESERHAQATKRGWMKRRANKTIAKEVAS